MKKVVLTFGVISGIVSSVLMLTVMHFVDRIGFDRGPIVGYTAMVVSFLLVFFVIRAYRENNGGRISFGRAFSVGILITMISCCFYVVTWELIYFVITPDFGQKMADYMVRQVQSSSESPQAIAQKIQELKHFNELYQNLFFNLAVTFIEPLPIGLIITLISAAILRRGKPVQASTQLESSQA